jgi:succinoglycan biosynthesis transport protein ExoP
MSLSLFLATLRARLAILSATAAVTLLVTLGLSLVWPKSYLANASLVVDTRNEQSLSDGFNVLASARERAGYLQTQVDILTSHKVALRVVADLGLAADPITQEQYAEQADDSGSIEDWLAANLLQGVDVRTTQSSVIDVSFLGSDPKTAADVANGFAQAYMDTMLELRVEPTRQAAAWFDEQLKTLRADLESAQARVTEFQRLHGIVSADESLDVEYVRFSDLSKQLLEAQQLALTLRTREQQIRDTVADGAPLEQLPEIQSDEQIARLKLDLVAGESSLETLATQYGSNYPEYQRQLAENASRRRALAAAMRMVVDTAASQREQSERREGEIETALEMQRSRLLELRKGRDELAVLAGNVQTAQRAYDTAMQRFVVSQVESRASQANVALLNPATAPVEPHRPNVPLNVAMSLVVGLLLGVGLAVVRELADRHVRTLTDLDYGPEIPQLGVLSAWERPPRLLLTGPGEPPAQPA